MSANHVYCLCPTDGTMILKTPALPVLEGDKVVLRCQYWTGNHNKTTFFKNGAEIITYTSSSSNRLIKMAIENVTQEDEGFYKCASQDRKMASPESWLSVRPDRGQQCGSIAFDDNIDHSAKCNISQSGSVKDGDCYVFKETSHQQTGQQPPQVVKSFRIINIFIY